MSFQPARILAATDFSDLSTHAIQWARMFAASYESRLSLLYAESAALSLTFPPYEALTPDISLQHLREVALRRLETYAAEHLAAVPFVERRITEDYPAAGILRTANDIHADLIVMGTHGRTGLSRVLLGSVAEKVLHQTAVPVLTVRNGSRREAAIRTILCPVNFTEVAREAVETAAAIARKFDAELMVLYLLDPSVSTSIEDEMGKLDAWLGTVGKEAAVKLLVHRGGDAAERAVMYAEQKEVSLIVLGAQHRRFGDTTVIGSTTERVTRHATAPVLTVVRRPD